MTIKADGRSPVRAVLIDLDDTLVDHQHAVSTALRALHGSDLRLQSLEYEFLLAEWQRVLESMHDDVALGRIPIHESRIIRYRHFYDLAGAPVDRFEAGQIAERHMQTYMASRRVVPGADALLRALQPHACVVVVTNNTVAEQREKLATFGMTSYVDELVTSEEFGAAKPDLAIFRHALERAGVAAAEAVMVGDSWANDVIGATNAGIRAVWLNRHGTPCPDVTLAHEITSFEPVARAAELVLNRPL
ncbi:MAG: HAD-IA family hydrolase [Betaproteobacteria bacterium]